MSEQLSGKVLALCLLLPGRHGALQMYSHSIVCLQPSVMLCWGQALDMGMTLLRAALSYHQSPVQAW